MVVDNIFLFGEILYDVFPDKKVPGGAPFNVACHLSALGKSCYLISATGDDRDGDELKKTVIKAGIKTDYLFTNNQQTGRAEIKLDSGGIPEFSINSNSAFDYIPDIPDITGLSLIYHGTLARRNRVSDRTLDNLLKRHRGNSLVFVDLNLRYPFYTDDIILKSLHSADILKINEDELAIISEITGCDRDIESLASRFSLATIIVTLGGDGAWLYNNGELKKYAAVPVKHMVDTVGAGDAFTAMFISSLIEKNTLHEGMTRSLEYAARICGMQGAVPLHKGADEYGELLPYLASLKNIDETLITERHISTEIVEQHMAPAIRVKNIFKFENALYFVYRSSPGIHHFCRYDNISGNEGVVCRIQPEEWLRKLNEAAGETDIKFTVDYRPFTSDDLDNESWCCGNIIGSAGIGNDADRMSDRLTGSIGNGVDRVLDILIGSLKENRAILFEILSEKNRNNLFFSNINSLAELTELITRHEAGYGSDGSFAAKTGAELGSFFKHPEHGRRRLTLLSELLRNPDREKLEQFVDVFPLITDIVLLSVHGWFAQDKVLGKPDTGGQVVYILDQVKALEKVLLEKLDNCCDLDNRQPIRPNIVIGTRLIPKAENTTCSEEHEKVRGTEHCYILRVPFRDEEGQIISGWISRFKIWPYLESYADDLREKLEETGVCPDYIIGNYSDGNYVSLILSHHSDMAVYSSVAHALEKSKYEFSEIEWKQNEDEYSFSRQYITDLVAMNSADFVVASTLQEIAGTEEKTGQYESHLNFIMPGFVMVKNGVNIFSHRFNILPPGVDFDYFFAPPDFNAPAETERLEKCLFFDQSDKSFGCFRNPEKPTLFSMARLDRIKNITGLLKVYAESESLRRNYNLLLVAGKISPDNTEDLEEKEQINLMHELLEKNRDLYGHVRWLELSLTKEQTGRAYRIIRRKKGVFVQPALYEAFGLTILEAMCTGLPVISTFYGGPAEIIDDGSTGFLVDVNNHDSFLNKLESVSEKLLNPSEYSRISRNAIDRVNTTYNWEIYARQQLKIAALHRMLRLSGDNIQQACREYSNLVLMLAGRNPFRGIR